MGMAFVAKYLSKEYLARQFATLSKALETVSTNLSIIALLGLALIPIVPDRAASTLSATPPPARSAVTAATPAPVEVVRAKPVLVPQAPLSMEAALRAPPPATLSFPAPPDTDTQAAPGAGPQAGPRGAEGSLHVLARVSRERRRRALRQQEQVKAESGETGKAGQKTVAAQTPVPRSDPKSEAAKAEPPEPDEWTEAEIIAALKDCLKRITPLGAEIEIAPAVKHEQCGAPAPVMLKRIGSGTSRVEFQPPPMLNCAMVASLHTWIEKTLQPTAQDVLGTSIVRLRGTSGYACRNRNGSSTHSDRLSEHALANAIDIMGFVTADGRTIDVLNKWGPTARDIREQKERAAEAQKERAVQAKTVAKKNDREVLDAARDAAKQALKDAVEAENAAAKAPRSKRKQAQAEAQRKRQEADRKADEVERLGEEAEQRVAEVQRGSLRTAGLQKLGKGVDAKAMDAKTADAKATPTTATANDATRPNAEGAFLRRLHKGACTAFGTVLGPEANEAHRNHFHFDLAPRKRSAFCE